MGKIEDKDIDIHIDHETLLQEYIPKADYENRLKADMAAMLNEVKAEIMNVYACDNDSKFVRMTCRDIIQEKINSLKEDTNQ